MHVHIICVYIYIYIHIYTYIHTHNIYIYIYILIHLSIYLSIYLSLSLYIYIYTYVSSPSDLQSDALPTELSRLVVIIITFICYICWHVLTDSLAHLSGTIPCKGSYSGPRLRLGHSCTRVTIISTIYISSNLKHNS